jgi:hypothetical protein
VLTRTNLHHNCFESLTYDKSRNLLAYCFLSFQLKFLICFGHAIKPDGELQLISKSLRVIRSRTGHVLVCHATPDVQDQITLTCCTKSIEFLPGSLSPVRQTEKTIPASRQCPRRPFTPRLFFQLQKDITRYFGDQ